MEKIGLYSQVTPFSTQHAGTAEWCRAERDGKPYFIKKFHSPVYPSKEIGLPEKMYQAGVQEFHDALSARREIYQRLRDCNSSGALVVPLEVINYQFHICTVAEFVAGNVAPEEICRLSEWQRLVLLRTLTLALMNVHRAGVVHSDMKPDNVLVSQDSEGHCRLRLIDFDSSFPESSPPSDPEEVVGDPAFFAPEAYLQSMEEDVRLDHRIDIFALGIIFHYFWCGKYPGKPADQTIGEYLVRGGKVTLDVSVPLVLRQLILRMMAREPAERMDLKKVYDVLGVQIGRYPSVLVNLQTARETGSSGKKSGSSESGSDSVKKKEIRVNFCDEGGAVLGYRSFQVRYGSKQTVKADKIAGYHVIGLETILIEVSPDGFARTPVTFTYRKDSGTEEKPRKKGRGWKILAACFLAYLTLMYTLAQTELGNRNYEQAKQYMDAFPFYSEIFPGDYGDAVNGIQEQMYRQGVTSYRNGNYREALSCFRSMDETYRDTRLYIDFCMAHLGSPEDYYETIVAHSDFEDAKQLLTENDRIFDLYMTGEWTCRDTSGGTRTVTIRDDESHTIYNMPEWPGGGNYKFSNGKFEYKSEGESDYSAFFTVTIVSGNEFRLYSLKSGTTYTLTRN